MMRAGRILDADMATVASWIRQGFAWWTEEVRAMVPARLRGRRALFAARIEWRGPGAWDRSGRGEALPVLIDPSLCLLRTMVLPPLGAADLQRLVRLDADRIMPMPAARLLIAAAADPVDRTQVAVAAWPREAAEAMLAELAAAGVVPTRIGLADPAAPGTMALDMTDAFAESGLIAPAGAAARPWWLVVGFLFLLNLGLLVLRDVQQVARLEALVAGQAPAVAAARAISGRIAGARQQAEELAALRQRQDGLSALAAVSEALPGAAWVQRYQWEGTALRLSGYKRQAVDVIGALRKSPRLTDVRAAGTEAIAAVPSGEPFDVSARVREPGR